MMLICLGVLYNGIAIGATTILSTLYGSAGGTATSSLNQGRISGISEWGTGAFGGSATNKAVYIWGWLSDGTTGNEIYGGVHDWLTSCTPFNLTHDDYITGYKVYSDGYVRGLEFSTLNGLHYECLAPNSEHLAHDAVSYYVGLNDYYYLTGWQGSAGAIIDRIQFQFTELLFYSSYTEGKNQVFANSAIPMPQFAEIVGSVSRTYCLSARFYSDSDPSMQCLLSTGSASASNAFNIVKYSSHIGVMGYDDNYYPTSGSVTYDSTDWNHYCITFDGTYIAVYVNGEIDNVVANPSLSTAATASQANYIGQSNDLPGNGQPFYGLIRNLRLFSTVLAHAHIQSLNAYDNAVFYQPLIGDDHPVLEQRFGKGTAMGDDIAFVGAIYDNSSRGAVYVFSKNRTTELWEQKQKITPSDSGEIRFGGAMDFDEATRVLSVGGQYRNTMSGAAYIFDEDIHGYWQQSQILVPSDVQQWDSCGISVSIENNVTVIGCMGDDSATDMGGAIHIFEYNGYNWTHAAKIAIPDPAGTNEFFGVATDISNGVIVVGASQWGNGKGAAYMIEKQAVWAVTQRIHPSFVFDWGLFGHRVRIDGNTVAISMPVDPNAVTVPGRVYIYTLINGSTWNKTDEIWPSGSDGLDTRFGDGMSLYNNTLVVGEPFNNDRNETGAGAFYVFEEMNGIWNEITKILPNVSGTARSGLQDCVTVYENRIMIGAYLDDTRGTDTGSAFIYERYGDHFARIPTEAPSNAPTQSPSNAPSEVPSQSPSSAPSAAPTHFPTDVPSQPPSSTPSQPPSSAPTIAPSQPPSRAPSQPPSSTPSQPPSAAPTQSPTKAPSSIPSAAPTQSPTIAPSQAPSQPPSSTPSQPPSSIPSAAPSQSPTKAPSHAPTEPPSNAPTFIPSDIPSTTSPTPVTQLPTVEPTPYDNYECEDTSHILVIFFDFVSDRDDFEDELIEIVITVMTDTIKALIDTEWNSDWCIDLTKNNLMEYSNPQESVRYRATFNINKSLKEDVFDNVRFFVFKKQLFDNLEQRVSGTSLMGDEGEGEFSMYDVQDIAENGTAVQSRSVPFFDVTDPLMIILIILIGFAVSIMIVGKIHAQCISADDFSISPVFLFTIYVWDFYTDLLFAISLYTVYKLNRMDYIILFIASIVFLIGPLAKNFYDLLQFEDVWRKHPILSDFYKTWLRDYAHHVYLLSFLCGSTYAAISLVNSNFLGHKAFSMGLSRVDVLKFNQKRLVNVVLLENLPQLVVQVIFAYRSKQLTDIALLAVTSSIVSVCIAVLKYINHQKVMNDEQSNEVMFSFKLYYSGDDNLELASYIHKTHATSKAVGLALELTDRTVECLRIDPTVIRGHGNGLKLTCVVKTTKKSVVELRSDLRDSCGRTEVVTGWHLNQQIANQWRIPRAQSNNLITLFNDDDFHAKMVHQNEEHSMKPTGSTQI